MAIEKDTPPAPTPIRPAAPPPAPVVKLTREQVVLEHMVEHYLQGSLPLKQKIELETFCRDNPQYLDEIKLSTRMNAGLKLIEAAGRPEPWNEKPPRFWHSDWFAALAVAATLIVAVVAWQFHSRADFFERQAAEADRRLRELPMLPAAKDRGVRLAPVAVLTENAMTIIGGGERAEFVTLNIDLSRSNSNHFDLEIERVGQGRVGILRSLRRNSNGLVSWSLNSSVLGPGVYAVNISGLDWRGQPSPAGFVSFEVEARRR
jgi:hypothetical protein